MEYFFNFQKINYLNEKKTGGCILCRMNDGDPQIIDTAVYRGSDTAVCLNLYPYNPGHIMIFPLRHVEDIRNLADTERHSLDAILEKTLNILDSLYTPSGYNIGFNMGLDAGASINHLHLHVIPRYPHELGIAELLGGKRVLVEDLNQTRERFIGAFSASSGGIT